MPQAAVDHDHDERDEQEERGGVTRRAVLAGLGAAVVAVGGGTVWFAATRYAAGGPQEGHQALTGASVLAGKDLEPLDEATVLVRDGVIVDVGTGVDVPAGSTLVDVSGYTLIPGLIDMHVHLGSPEQERGEGMSPTRLPGLLLDMIRHVPRTRRALLNHGVTTVRSLGDDHGWVMELRRLLRDGELEGPRLFAAGPLFTTPGGHPIVTFGVDPDSDGVRLPATPEQARRAVRDLAGGAAPDGQGAGDGAVDLIKVVQERGGPGLAMDPLPPDVLEAIVAEAHEHGLRVTTHWGTVEDLREAVAAGVDGLEHVEARGVLDGWPDGLLDTLVERDISLTPTLAVTEVALDGEDHRRLRQRVSELHTAGVRIVAGSDAGVPGVPFGGGLHRELELLVDSGLTPRDALRAATSEAARVLGAGDIGAIEPGAVADLVALDGDPLRQITDIRNVVLVMRDGRLVVDRRDT